MRFLISSFAFVSILALGGCKNAPTENPTPQVAKEPIAVEDAGLPSKVDPLPPTQTVDAGMPGVPSKPELPPTPSK